MPSAEEEGFLRGQFAKIMNSNIRPYDLIGRYGGEEFIVIVEDIDLKQIEKKIVKILEKVRTLVFYFNGLPLKVTFSAGIVHSHEMGSEMTVEKMIEKADERLYLAKNQGRNRVICE